MRYFIRINKNGQIINYAFGNLSDDYIKTLKGYIEIDEQKGAMLNCGRPLKYIDGEIVVDTEAEQIISR